jgi:hypothetical protein
MTSHRTGIGACTTCIALALGAVGLIAFGPNGSVAQQSGHEGHDHGDAKAGGMPARNPQNWAPVDKMHLYLCAFHVAKENPKFQVEAHHFCSPQAGSLHQCVIYDNRSPASKLLGVEYIISDDDYQKLPAAEKKYWHPHAYEILSGQLVAPDFPMQGDAIFPGLINTWGKTWHTWPDPTTAMPTGEPILMWSANGDGQIREDLISKRDAQFGINSNEIRKRRAAWGYEVPQVPAVKGMDEIGRRWTATGKDEPTRTKGAGG